LLCKEDFVAFLKRCAEALRENGIIVIKDNLNSKEGFYVDKEDNSITRSAILYPLLLSFSTHFIFSPSRAHFIATTLMTTGPTGTCVGCSRRRG
jgi:hypothetical protein